MKAGGMTKPVSWSLWAGACFVASFVVRWKMGLEHPSCGREEGYEGSTVKPSLSQMGVGGRGNGERAEGRTVGGRIWQC